MIGIVGLGDLGGRLALQALATGNAPAVFDITTPASPPSAVDPAISTAGLALPPLVSSVDMLVEQSDIIHWCAPLSALDSLPTLPDDKLLILHNSVMNASFESKANLGSPTAVVHCLMNNRRTVVIATESDNRERTADHFRALGLRPVLKDCREHDRIMARSQGIFALLIQHGIRQHLERWHEQGLLTSSAEELLRAVAHRESQWTAVTIGAILSNPALKDFAAELAEELR